MTRYLLDVNVWLALCLDFHPNHSKTLNWFNAISASDELMFCRLTQQSLLRLLATTAAFSQIGRDPLSNDEAWAVVDAVLSDPQVRLELLEPLGLEEMWRTYSAMTKPSPKRWMDAYLAGFSAAPGVVLVSLDRGFEFTKAWSWWRHSVAWNQTPMTSMSPSSARMSKSASWVTIGSRFASAVAASQRSLTPQLRPA